MRHVLLGILLVLSPVVIPQDELEVVAKIEASQEIKDKTHLLTERQAHDEMKCSYRLDAIEDDIHEHIGTAVGVDLSEDKSFKEFNPKRAKRYLLTAAHVVIGDKNKSRKLELYLPNSIALCRIVKIDRAVDIAIIMSDEDLPAQAKIDDTKIIVGIELINVGCPHGGDLRAAAGVAVTEQTSYKWIATATGYTRGCSGGGWFHDHKIIGISVEGILDKADPTAKPGTERPMHEGVGVFLSNQVIKDFISGVF